MADLKILACIGMIAAISGCALQASYAPPAMNAPTRWSEVQGLKRTSESDPLFPERWWTALHDTGVDALVRAALEDSPTLDEAVARTDEARAVLQGAGAQRMPSLQASGGAIRQRDAAAGAGQTVLSNVANASVGISYEVDLFGRVRESVRAAEIRVAARSAEVLGARPVGVDARIEESRAMTSLASARTEAALLNQECERQAHALYVLTGIEGVDVRSILLGAGCENAPPFMPRSPALPLPLSATLLADHPDLVAADRDTAAAWSEIGAARAARLPRVDLGAMLTGKWLRAAGSTLDFTTWSLGPSLTAPVFDGGAGASNVYAAEARYRAAQARLRLAVRRVVQEVEQALASEESSRTRMSSTQEALAAARDHVQAWIALIKAIGVVTPAIQGSE